MKKKRYRIITYDDGRAIFEDTVEGKSASFDLYDTRIFYFCDLLNDYDETVTRHLEIIPRLLTEMRRLTLENSELKNNLKMRCNEYEHLSRL